MAGAREIRSKIKSTQNMRKVTGALQMVSASKVRKAQEQMSASRPYARLMRRLIAHVAKAHTEVSSPLLQAREQVKRVAYLVVSSDRGLCGGLNANLFRRLHSEIREWQAKGAEVEVVAIGQKAVSYFRRVNGVKLLGCATHLGDKPKLESLIGVIKLLIDGYTSGQLDRVFVAYNRFHNAMLQKPVTEGLLPLSIAGEADGQNYAEDLPAHDWDYIYEPDPETVLEHVLTRYVESLVYQGVVENLASEHAARMVAMKAASDNAKKVINTLTLSYNKARQAAITQEISEIAGGAAAI
ncbi:F0F1 ATP synthase subunit gamma [Frateuria aurantia]